MLDYFKLPALFLVAGLLVFHCAAPRYVLVTEKELSGIVEKHHGLPYKRYVIIPIDKYSNNPDIRNLLQETCTLIKGHKYDSLARFLGSYENRSTGCLGYSKALYLQFTGDYRGSYDQLLTADTLGCNCESALLRADSYFENHETGRYEDVLRLYQNAIDCKDDDLWKLLIQTRTRLARYNK